jgi:hypothetical protein
LQDGAQKVIHRLRASIQCAHIPIQPVAGMLRQIKARGRAS